MLNVEARSAFSDGVVLSCAVLCCYVEALSVVLSCIMLCGCVTAGRKALYAEALNAFKE